MKLQLFKGYRLVSFFLLEIFGKRENIIFLSLYIEKKCRLMENKLVGFFMV